MNGPGNALAVTALVAFINTVYERPWAQDERALLLPGIIGGIVGYAIGNQIGKDRRWHWGILMLSAVVSLVLSWVYNEILLRGEVEWLYGLDLYLCLMLMNMAAFCVFGVVGWKLAAESGEKGEGA